MLGLWQRCLNLGAEGVENYARRYIVLTNATAILAISVVVVYLPFAILSLPAATWSRLILQIPLYSVALLLNARQRHTAATTWLVFSTGFVFTAQAIYFGPECGHRFFFLAYLAAVPLAFPHTQRTRRIVMLGVGFIALFGLELFAPGPFMILDATATRWTWFSIILGSAICVVAISAIAQTLIRMAELRAEDAHDRSERLLRKVFPEEIARRLKDEDQVADRFEDVTILFADLAGFTARSADRPPAEVVAELNEIFSAFDHLLDAHGLEKVKTIGDAYMAVGGIGGQTDHVERSCELARAMISMLDELAIEGLALRVGIHCGPVVAGVIGRARFAWDVWGDAVNIASRMESTGEAGRIQLSSVIAGRLGPRFAVERRGEIEVKGRGVMETFWLTAPA